jgi:molybdopterin converting factor small subunit
VKVEVRLFALLRDKLPDAPRGRATIELAEGASLLDLLARLDIPSDVATMVLINGERVSRDDEQRAAWQLAPGDDVAIFPPVAGG